MGICSSCLGRESASEGEQQRLLADDGYSHPNHHYGAWHQPPAPHPNALSPEEQKREQEAMRNIMQWANNQIVDIFPAVARNQNRQQPSQQNGKITPEPALDSSLVSLPNGDSDNGITSPQHQDILLSMIPGDRSKRSIRIFAAQRPGTGDTSSIRSKASHTRLNALGNKSSDHDGIFVKLQVELPAQNTPAH